MIARAFYFFKLIGGRLLLALGAMQAVLAALAVVSGILLPRGDTLAFIEQKREGSRLYMIDVERGRTVYVSRGVNDAREPRWSPDGSRLAFSATLNNYRQVMLMNADGRGMYQLSRDTTSTQHPAWSPDGSRVVLATYLYLGVPQELRIIGLNDTAIEVLYAARVIYDITWSPDGSQVAFTSGADNAEIYVAEVGGMGPRKLVEDRALDRQPAWSPDGRSLAFISNRTTIDHVYRVDAVTGATEQLTFGQADHYSPAWSPDGRSLAYNRLPRAGAANSIMVLDIATRQARPLVSGAYRYSEITWSPDGERLAFVAEYRHPFPQVFIVDADGSGLRALTPLGGIVSSPQWRP